MVGNKDTYNIKWLTAKFDAGESLDYLFFWGNKTNKQEPGKQCFSQWYESPFIVDDIKYHTAEHWMMAQKAILFEDIEIFEKIIDATTSKEAKELGRLIRGFDEVVWEQKRFDIVKTGNIHKFNQNPDLTKYLLAKGDRIIVEASPIDIIWGIGLTQDSSGIDNIYEWRGLNLLGFALMEVRDFLREFGHFSPLQNAMLPQWEKYPKIGPSDMFWRMGLGEDYVIAFGKWHENLSGRDKLIYKLTNPSPTEWEYFND